MRIAFECLRALSILSFVFAGVACLRAPHMRREFERYGLARFRRLTGCLQLAGATGLTVGLAAPPLTSLAAGGLSLLMLLGVAARLRVQDSMSQVTPAALLSVSNLVLLTMSMALPP